MTKIRVPKPVGAQVLIKMAAAALNHRDHFLRQDLYPKPQFGIALGSDGVGTVIDVGQSASGRWIGRRVTINPGLGWASDPEAPETPEGYLTLGASLAGIGTLQEYVLVDQAEIADVPDHLTDVEAAAIPAAGLTAWRAVMVRCQNALAGRNILVTGIGGGVALFALQLAVAVGCRVFVTSSKEEKLRRARELGAAGGVLYTQPDWEMEILELLPKDRPLFDAIVDGAGGDIVKSGVKLLRQNGTIVCYGMTQGPSMPFTMKAVARNIQLVASTMGPRKEFFAMLDFIRLHKIKPLVSEVVQGLDDIDQLERLWKTMAKGAQFGKLVVQLSSNLHKTSKL